MANLFDLNDRLFREMDRLESAAPDELENEIGRAKAIGDMAGKIIDNAAVAIRAAALQQQALDDTAARVVVPKLLVGDAPTIAERDEAI